MNDLVSKKCISCEGNIPKFNIDEIHKYLKKVDGWDVIEDQSSSFYLIKEFKFKNFIESQNFINKVGKIAEKEGHHPSRYMVWLGICKNQNFYPFHKRFGSKRFYTCCQN